MLVYVVRLFHVMLGRFRLDQVRSGYIMLCQVISRYVRLGKVRPVYSSVFNLCHVNS